MNAITPPKHKTQNYRLVTHRRPFVDLLGRKRVSVWSEWTAMPLRSTRKDI